MKKLLSLFLIAVFSVSLFTAFSVKTRAGAYNGEELFDENLNYIGPKTDENGRTQEEAVKYFRENLQLGDFYPETDTEQQVKLLAENGVQYAFLWGFTYDDPQDIERLKWCMKYGVKVFLMDSYVKKLPWNSNELKTVEDFKALIKPSLGNPYVLGYDLWDEPATTHGNVPLINFVKNFKEATEGTPLITFVNLYPQAERKWDKTYLDGSFEALGLDFVSTDIYPYMADYTVDYYVQNVTAAGTSAREHNGEFWQYLQSMPLTSENKRAPELKELRQQAYIGLANGLQKITHFYFRETALDKDGNKTPIYFDRLTLNKEMQFLAPYYRDFKNTGIIFVEGTKKNVPEYLRKKLFGITGEDTYINSVSSEEALLVGKFDSKTDNRKAFVFANASDVYKNLSTEVAFKVPSEKLTLVYEGREETLYPDETGLYKITLKGGDGVFLIAEPTLSEEEKAAAVKVDEMRKVLLEKVHNEEAYENDYIYEPESYGALKAYASALDEALRNKDLKKIDSLYETFSKTAEKVVTQLDYYKGLAKPYLDLRTELKPSSFTEKSWSAFAKMAENLKKKCDTTEFSEYVNIKSYLNYAKKTTLKLEYSGVFGDVDKSGELTLNDGMIIINAVAKKGSLTSEQFFIANTDKSEAVDLKDAMVLINKVAKKVSAKT